MSDSSPERNKATVLEAFETLFNKARLYGGGRFWSPNNIQHSAHIPPCRVWLFNLVRSVPATLHYETPAHRVAEAQGRHSAWPLHRDGKARRLDRRRRYPARRRSSQRTLGRFAGQGHDQGGQNPCDDGLPMFWLTHSPK